MRTNLKEFTYSKKVDTISICANIVYKLIKGASA